MSTTEPTPNELAALQQAAQQAMPYWIEFCRGRSDEAAVAVAEVWVAIQQVLGNNPQQVTNTQTVTVVTDGTTTQTETYTVTHAIWCPTPVYPSSGTCPNCSAHSKLGPPAVVGS